ncbi:CLUMA_CG004996, isoform A [Clunio marinus]|uniref:CLUMA_CG004996, isoform A n=1 Tax=Clunio marinus TaxID=568069 RepID=A0A1J1HUV4_9DIPT|nr:CLUMA_CG004996, isoform A [Clunio marinus]
MVQYLFSETEHVVDSERKMGFVVTTRTVIAQFGIAMRTQLDQNSRLEEACGLYNKNKSSCSDDCSEWVSVATTESCDEILILGFIIFLYMSRESRPKKNLKYTKSLLFSLHETITRAAVAKHKVMRLN